jgi:hypothetical protein
MFKTSSPPPEDDAPRIILLPPPDFAAEVEKQLRIADAERWARLMWNAILEDYRADSERQRYTR